jgi:hypothetical protein
MMFNSEKTKGEFTVPEVKQKWSIEDSISNN